jgi:hypothetical protein
MSGERKGARWQRNGCAGRRIRTVAHAAFAGVLFVAGCGGQTGDGGGGGTTRQPPGPASWLGVDGARLLSLPPQGGYKVGYFQSAQACAQCHTAVDGNPALHDAAGRDVSPVALYRSSMMALAARDPFYLATVSHELAARPGAADAIEAACTRCHAPGADVDLRPSGKHVGFAMLTSDTSAEGELARDGVGCTLCHEISAAGLGTPASFGGQLSVTGTTIFGQYDDPLTSPMQFFVSYTPAFGAHMQKSDLCATCHTVITHALDDAGNAVGPAFYEQAAFLEWQASSFAGTKTCQDCHTPASDDDGNPITTPIARPPQQAVSPRGAFGRHTFVGANGYVVRLVADNADWAGTTTPAAELGDHAARADANVAGAATVTIASAVRDGDAVVVTVKVHNRSGHKFPTGYPSRRAFLHVTLASGGATLFESGATDDAGRLIDGHGNLVDVPGELHPHRDLVTHDDEVQIYESVAGDASGKIARTVVDAVSYLKDNRLLPDGWSHSATGAAMTAPVGTSDDANFGSEDTVTYRVSAASGALTIDVELLYQTLRPTDLDALAARPTDATRRFFDMVAARAPAPIGVARAQLVLP